MKVNIVMPSNENSTLLHFGMVLRDRVVSVVDYLSTGLYLYGFEFPPCPEGFFLLGNFHKLKKNNTQKYIRNWNSKYCESNSCEKKLRLYLP